MSFVVGDMTFQLYNNPAVGGTFDWIVEHSSV